MTSSLWVVEVESAGRWRRWSDAATRTEAERQAQRLRAYSVAARVVEYRRVEEAP